MKIEEAIKHGEEQLEIFGGEHREFIELAIKSLEAWGKVKKEIDDSISVCESDAMRDTWCDGELAGFLQSKDIINRNLSEVEE